MVHVHLRNDTHQVQIHTFVHALTLFAELDLLCSRMLHSSQCTLLLGGPHQLGGLPYHHGDL